MRTALLLGFGSLFIASAASADICTEHGYPMGTQGYLDCWRYVNEVNQQNRAQNQNMYRDWMNYGAQLQQMQHPAQSQQQFIQPAPTWCPNGARWCR